MNGVFFLVLRRMRAPLVALIAIYAVSVLGLTLVPGVDAAGQPTPPLSFFHAFYFVSYTATTIGFGEIPAPFSDGQRLWVTVCVYLTVVGWTYTLLTLLALVQDKGFQNTLVANRFARRVKRIDAPFYLVCGCGETGSLICHTLDRLGHEFVIIEINELRVQELDLEDFKSDIPTLLGDARQPANLLLAGLCHQQCRGVLAVTNDESSNLAIAVAARLLNPKIPVLARAWSPLVTANMASFGTNHIINPFEHFAEYLALAVATPERVRLVEILTGLPGLPLPEEYRPPHGEWIICGYGRFGKAIVHHLAAAGVKVRVIEPSGQGPEGVPCIRGLGTEAGTLREAGIEQATGIVAGSDDDVNNLSIAMTAQELKPGIFIVTRQNQAANGVLFDAFQGDFSMVPSRIVAQECIAILTTPLLAAFLEQLRRAEEGWCEALAARLEILCEGRVPVVWDVSLSAGGGVAAYRALSRGRTITLGQLLASDAGSAVPLPVMVLMIQRNGDTILLPDPGFALAAGDRLLLAGRRRARNVLELTLSNTNMLEYVLTGEEQLGGWLWHRLFRRQAGTP
ncbi:MAG TPA: NAD-binding protein [Rhodocyclaceae bacterium]|nr:NAD-binding protein [Rhodocyclaceae bacterium]